MLARTAAVPAARAVAPHAQVKRNIVYENVNGRTERLDVYEPATAPPAGGWPVIVAIHGGGWRKFDKTEYGPKIAAQFVAHGFAVVAPNYQLSAPGRPSWPNNLNDLRNAVSWVRANASRLHIDTSRISAMGESAGAHLAALLGTDPGSAAARVDAVIAFYAPTDLARLAAESKGGALAAAQFLGGTPQQRASAYADASPTTHVAPGAPPMMLFQGSADTLVPPDQAVALANDLTAAGVVNQLVIVPGATHGFEFQPRGVRLVPRILAFLSAAARG